MTSEVFYAVVATLLISLAQATIVTDTVELDISIDHVHAGTVQLALFGRMARKTVRSFIQLATDGAVVAGRRYHYAGSAIHRVVPNLLIEGGSCNGDGPAAVGAAAGGVQPKLALDTVVSGPVVPFEVPGLLSMSSTIDNDKGCLFFITLYQVTYLNGKYVPFGKVVSGMDVVERIAELTTGPDEVPLKRVTITAARHSTVQHPYFVQLHPAQGAMFWVKLVGLPLVITAILAALCRSVLKNFDTCDAVDFEIIAKRQLMEKKLLEKKTRHSDMPKKDQ